MTPLQNSSDANPTDETIEIDNAFESEFGVSFTETSLIRGALIELCLE